ncbi:hypothetical protein BH11PLA2_BH11PLA2_32190 [soil metagenome]
MTRTLLTVTILLLTTTAASAQIGRGGGGNRGGGGGGMNRGGGGGGAAARPSFTPQPQARPQQMQRPAQPQQRPQAPQMQRPATPQRPSVQPGLVPQSRPQTLPGNAGQSRPNLPQTLPGNAGQSRPNLPQTLPGNAGQSRPNLPQTLPGNAGQSRPNLPQTLPGNAGQTRPNLPNTLPGNAGTTRPNLPNTLPSTRPNLPETKPNLPSTLPGNVGNRPNFPNTLPSTRPNLPGTLPGNVGNRPNLPDTRPNVPGNWNPGDRPNIGGSGSLLRPGVLPERPNINPDNRPDWGNRPNNSINNGIINNRPNINTGNVNTGNIINNRPVNNNVINNRPINNNFNTIAPTIYNPNRPYGGYTKPYYGGVYRPYGYANYGNNHMWGNYYVGRYYSGWHCGYWNSPFHYPYGFVARPVPLGWLLPASVNWNYYNPYWSQPQTVVQYVNYSQPLPVDSQVEQAAPIETPYTPAVAPTVDDTKAKDAAAIFDTARAAFMKNDYASAEATITKAIAILPQDPTLHEFRALTLFAQGKYVDSAAAIYAVLAAGPGWNSETLYALYPDQQTFANQLAALEQFAKANPTSGPAFFLLGYEYLTLGDKDKAATAFEAAYKIEPKDELSKIMAQNLRTPADATQP